MTPQTPEQIAGRLTKAQADVLTKLPPPFALDTAMDAPPADSADMIAPVGVVWREGRDAVLDFRHQFCGSPSRATVLGDLENYTEYADECEALARKVAALSAMSPAGEVDRMRQQGQREGFAAAVSWLRERGAMKPRASLWQAAETLADQMEQSRIPGGAK